MFFAQVDFVPWIPGLPTLVLIFRPSALIINLTSEQVYLGLWTGEDPDPEDDGEIGFLIPFKAVFAPPRISMGSVSDLHVVNYTKMIVEW